MTTSASSFKRIQYIKVQSSQWICIKKYECFLSRAYNDSLYQTGGMPNIPVSQAVPVTS